LKVELKKNKFSSLLLNYYIKKDILHTMKNYYQCLNLAQNASLEEIKTTYRIYATKFHPDKHQNDTFFKERFQEIQEAYEVLSNTEKRKEYDKIFFNRNNINSPEVILTVNKSKFTVGERVIFNWTTKNVDYIVIKGFGTFTPTDTFTTIITKTTIFNFSFQGQGGITTKTKEILLEDIKTEPPPIVKLDVDKTYLNKNEIAIFRWTCFNVVNVEIIGYGDVTNLNEFKVRISETEEFKFIFKGKGGTQNIYRTIHIRDEEDKIKSNQTTINKRIITRLKKYTEFSGRARRKEFWYFKLICLIFFIIAMILDNRLGITISYSSYGPFSIVCLLLLLIPIYVIDVRRLHDVDKSGWMLLLLILPYIGWIWLLILFCREGTPGRNKYGLDPKEL